jgi:hypothetical protein
MKFSNQLAVVLLNTQREYLAGHTHKCLDSFFKTTVSLDKKIDLLIYFNKGDASEYNDLLEYKNCENVNDVKIHSHQLTGLDDLYARTTYEVKSKNLQKLPDLGGSAGPNNLFFNSMIPLVGSQYRDFLMLEPDTQPIQSLWIDKIIQYCNSERFLVAGSCYRGSRGFYPYFYWSGHINGVAIYRNIPILKVLFQHSKKLIEREVKYNSQELISFDVAMYQLSCTLSGRKYFNNRNLPDHQLIDCPIISNYSLEEDIGISINEVKKDHPQTIILHKKTQTLSTNLNQPKIVPVFLHIPKNGGTYTMNLLMAYFSRIFNEPQNQEDFFIKRITVESDSYNLTVFVKFTDEYHKTDSLIKLHPFAIKSGADNPKARACAMPTLKEYLTNKRLIILAINVEPISDNDMRVGLEEAHNLLGLVNSRPCNFTLMRDTLSRQQSLFYYLTGEESSHEPTHGSIVQTSLIDYLQSEDLEDSWLVRVLTDVPSDTNLNEHWFNKTIDYLNSNHFSIGDISQADETINKILNDCYGEKINQLDKQSIFRNSTQNQHKITINDLNEKTKQKFLDRTYWDRKLWERYCKNV